MPWWRFWRENTEDEQQAEERAAMRAEQQKQDIIALQNGDLPAIAKERILKHSSRTDNFFSSDLSVNEFLLMKESGVQVISQVMGTCFYNLSLFGGINTYAYTGEMRDLTAAQSDSRALAIERMEQEAKLLGADGVVGVRLKVKNPTAGHRHFEFTAYGTAVRIAGYPKRGKTFASNLSGQEFWKLHNARYLPVGLVMGCCSYYVRQDWRAASSQGFLGVLNSANIEVESYTASFYEARERAMERLQKESEALGADGVIGVNIEFNIEPVEYEQNDQKRIDLLLHYTAIGTAIHEREGVSVRAPLAYIDLSKRKLSGARVALDETDTTDEEGI